ncbi:MAG: leucyl aminopeptidase [Smithellaceae bacterium]|nr:leucyl aminopeptidase [Smithellaceae bacterium]
MKINVRRGDITEQKTAALIVTHFEDVVGLEGIAASLDQKCRGAIGDLIKSGDFDGKLCKSSLLHTRDLPTARILLIGLGKRVEFNIDKLREAYAKAAVILRDLNLRNIALAVELPDERWTLAETAEAIIEGVCLGLYQYTPFKTVERDKIKEIDELAVWVADKASFPDVNAAVERAEIVSSAVNYVRDLVSAPSNEMTPSDLAGEAEQIGRLKNVKLKVMEEAEMKELGMNSLLGVAKGSDEAAKFIILEYQGGKKAEPLIALVGKGITFDSGGISIKPAEKMEEMKSDMAGGAAVLGTIMAAAKLALPLNIVGLVPATENLPSGHAYKPGDILKSLSGQTIEVITTDAEGRLILADALTYAGKFKPEAIIDLATLTGACVIALGDYVMGMMGNNNKLKALVCEASARTGEKLWELPLWDDYHEQIKSDIADYRNSGGRAAGTITAAAFLSKFAGEFPWVHLDIAGPAWLSKDRPYAPKGASGAGVRLLIDLLRHWKAPFVAE